MTIAQITINDAQLDAAINELGVVMNGGADEGVEVPPFMEGPMVEMRAIIRKLLAQGAAVTQSHP
jgi:hypothetical protein